MIKNIMDKFDLSQLGSQKIDYENSSSSGNIQSSHPSSLPETSQQPSYYARPVSTVGPKSTNRQRSGPEKGIATNLGSKNDSKSISA